MRGGPRSFPWDSSCPAVLRPRPGRRGAAYGALTPCGRPSQSRSAVPPSPALGAPSPGRPCRPPGLGTPGFARRYSRARCCFLFLRLLRCFSSPGVPPRGHCPPPRRPGLPRPGSPIRIPADRRACAPPRGFSQLVASFFGSQCQGIRPAPLPAWPCADAPASASHRQAGCTSLDCSTSPALRPLFALDSVPSSFSQVLLAIGFVISCAVCPCIRPSDVLTLFMLMAALSGAHE